MKPRHIAAISAFCFQLSSFSASAFEGKVPEGWLRLENTFSGITVVKYESLQPEGDYRLEVYAYPKGNSFKMTEKRYRSELETRAKRPPARIKAGAKDAAVFKAVPVPASAWNAAHADPDEALLGASGGDFSALKKLQRCRAQGAWKKYAWYRDVYEKKSDPALFREHWTERDGKIVAACLGQERLRDIAENRKPDPDENEPDDAGLERRAKALEADRLRPAREESVYAEPAKDGGFFVLRYESPAGKQDRFFPAYLRLIATFKE